MKEIDMAKMRLEEQDKYSKKLEDYKQTLNKLHEQKLVKLKQREADILRILKLKNDDFDKNAFDQRQRILRDFDALKKNRDLSDEKILKDKQVNFTFQYFISSSLFKQRNRDFSC